MAWVTKEKTKAVDVHDQRKALRAMSSPTNIKTCIKSSPSSHQTKALLAE